MQIEQKNDKWHVYWAAHIHKALQAADWCQESFGPHWGEFQRGSVGATGIGKHVFVFFRLSHAQWFQLKHGSF
jgi:hypothetical protein